MANIYIYEIDKLYLISHHPDMESRLKEKMEEKMEEQALNWPAQDEKVKSEAQMMLNSRNSRNTFANSPWINKKTFITYLNEWLDHTQNGALMQKKAGVLREKTMKIDTSDLIRSANQMFAETYTANQKNHREIVSSLWKL